MLNEKMDIWALGKVLAELGGALTPAVGAPLGAHPTLVDAVEQCLIAHQACRSATAGDLARRMRELADEAEEAFGMTPTSN